MIRQKNAWTCIPAAGYDFPTSASAKDVDRGGEEGKQNDTGTKLKVNVTVSTTTTNPKDVNELVVGNEMKQNEDEIKAVSYRHYEARLPVTNVNLSSRQAVGRTDGGRLARLSTTSTYMESKWKASEDDWASMRVVPAQKDGDGDEIGSNGPVAASSQKRADIREQKQIQKLQRRGSMTMQLVHKGKKALSKRARKAKVQERAKKAANVLTQSAIFKQLVDTAYVHCCEAAAEAEDREQGHTRSGSTHRRGGGAKSQQDKLLNSSFASLLGGKSKRTEHQRRIQRIAEEGHIGPTELYAGLLWVHVQLAKFLGAAALFPPPRQVIYDLFLISDVDDSGGIDRDEFNLIASTTCAQILGRLGIAYLARFLILPVLSSWLVSSFVPFSSLLPHVIHTVLEQITASLLFMIILPAWFGWVDMQSCVSAEKKASKTIEKRKRKEMQRELKRSQGSDNGGKVESNDDPLAYQEEEKYDEGSIDGIGDITEITVKLDSPSAVDVGSDNVKAVAIVNRLNVTTKGSDDVDQPRSIVRHTSSASTTSSRESSIELDPRNETDDDYDDDDDDDEDDDMFSLDEEEYEDSDDDDEAYSDDNDDPLVESASGIFMSIHSRPTPDSSNSDMSTHAGNHFGASAATFNDNDIVSVEQIEPSGRDTSEGDDDEGMLDVLAMRPLFRQGSQDVSDSSNMNDANEDEDSLGFKASAVEDDDDKPEWEKKRD